MAVSVYKTICEKKNLFIQAPTGTGKTVSTLFPSIKAMGEGHIEKIFYLTAKTITRQIAEESIEKMREKGLELKNITLTAKEKLCFMDDVVCSGEHCCYARGYYERINDAVADIYEMERAFTRENIEKYARKHEVCPFEFSLDLSLWSDCVICDYNYVFDPRVYLKRFFQYNGGNYTFLIDEAHNLVDRSRGMFSSELHKRPFMELKKVFKEKSKPIFNSLKKKNIYGKPEKGIWREQILYA